MSRNKSVDFTKYVWEAPSSRFGYLFYSFISWIGNIFWTTNVVTPYGYKIPRFLNLSSKRVMELTYKTWLIEIGKTIGIDDERYYPSLQYHWRRIQAYNQIGVFLTFMLVVGVSIFAIEISTRMFYDFFVLLALSTGKIYYPGLIIVTFILVWVVFQISKKFLASVLNRYYADSLTLVGALYLMIELLRKNALDIPSNRKRLQNRIHRLGQNILMLSYQFESESPDGQNLIFSHFKSMERYVQDHERLIVAPLENSLDILREDFYSLLKILFSGKYGEFTYNTQQSAFDQSTKIDRIVRATLGLVGFIVPSLILYALYINPQRFINMGIDLSTVTVIALAWLLLTIDATLKLGIVERITGLAKTIRDLG